MALPSDRNSSLSFAQQVIEVVWGEQRVPFLPLKTSVSHLVLQFLETYFSSILRAPCRDSMSYLGYSELCIRAKSDIYRPSKTNICTFFFVTPIKTREVFRGTRRETNGKTAYQYSFSSELSRDSVIAFEYLMYLEHNV